MHFYLICSEILNTYIVVAYYLNNYDMYVYNMLEISQGIVFELRRAVQ